MNQNIVHYSQLSNKDIIRAGGKNISLVELTQNTRLKLLTDIRLKLVYAVRASSDYPSLHNSW